MAYNRTLQHFTSAQELATVWSSGQNYIVNQFVVYNDKLYICSTAHTSGATFNGDLAYWDGILPGDILSIADGGTGQSTSFAAFSALAPTTNAGDLIVHNGTNNVREPVGTDGQVLVVDTSQTNKIKWATVPKGAKNYITYGDFENNATTGWSLSHTTIDATTKLPNQASGFWTSAAGTLSRSVISSGQLAGSYSLSLASSVATTAGDMLVSDQILLDLEAQASVQTFSFFYKIASGASNGNFSGTSSNSIGVAIYDVTNGAWIDPAGRYNIVQSAGVGKCAGTFQVPANCTSVRLAVYFPNATSGAITVYLDDFVLGPQVVQYGAPIGDWTPYTVPVSTGTFTNRLGWYRRVGDSLEVQMSIGPCTADGSGLYEFGLPSGPSIDMTGNKGPSVTPSITQINGGNYTLGAPVGFASLNTQGGVWYGDGFGASLQNETVFVCSATTVAIVSGSHTQATRAEGIGSALTLSGVAATIQLHFIVPIAGWSSSVSMSNDTDTRVVAARITKNSAQAGVATNTQITFDNPTKDTHAAWNVAGSYYQVPVSGWYDITANAYASGATAGAGLFAWSIDSGATKYYFGGTALTADRLSATTTAYFLAGQQIKLYWAGATVTINSGDTNTSVSFVMRSGPATIAASETVAAYIRRSAGDQSIGAGGGSVSYIGTAIVDTHGAYNSSTGVYTVPVSGVYEATFRTTMTTGTATGMDAILTINGTTFYGSNAIDSPTSGNWRTVTVTAIASLSAGNTISATSAANNSVTVVGADSRANGLAIKRLK